MDLLAQVLINGMLLGGLYAVMALGRALVWGVLNIVNLAHGAFIMLGGYVSWYLYTYAGIDPFLGLPLTAVVMFAVGYGVQRGLLNLIVRAPMFSTLLVTFGIEVVITYLAQLAFSADFRTINPSSAGNSIAFGAVVLPVSRLFAFGIAIVLTVGMWLFLLRTRLGRAIRATAQNLVAARLYGVDPRHLYAMTFGIGVALAGAAGGLYGTVSQINPYIGAALTAKCFVISIIGGLDNPLGVIVGGLFLGVLESLTALDLLRRGKLRRAGVGANRASQRSIGEGGMKTARTMLLLAALAVLAAVPWFGSDVLIQFGINALLLAVLAQSWNVIGGYAGYASFGNSVFYGLGSYGVAIAMAQWQLPFWVGLLFGAALAVVFAVLIGMPVLRLRGHYFAMATLALAQVMAAIVSNVKLAGRNVGLVLPPLNNDPLFYELSLLLLVLATLTVYWLTRSRFGFGLIAIRENEEGAAVMGVNTTLYKTVAFAISGVFSALAGGIHAYWVTFIDPESAFDIGLNVKMIIMAVFGGPGTVFGPVVGVLSLSAVSELLSSEITSFAGLFFGVVVVVAVVLMPRGLADVLRRFRGTGWRYFGENIRSHQL
ncbi:ABC-type branched-subunit amino acid transport system permease subunit [Bradyrhizobium sp. USDA 326]